ncbi:MAG TPA: tetratricopeptide repeat protein, partial [Steroidobacteraceae bacterium]|nr:tetratricopeptide repeat protein [Steroidobacteraceae bacterium]
MNLQVAGQLDLAEQLYRSILNAQPTHAVANHCLGMLHVQMRRPADGLPFLLSALNAHPEIPDYWLGYLEALFQSDQIDAAKETLALGHQHGLSGAAVEEFAQRLETGLPQPVKADPPAPVSAPPPRSRQSPGSPRTGVASRRESRMERAQADTLQIMIAQKRFADALVAARDMTQRFPEHGLGWKQLGALLWWKGFSDEAFVPMQNSVRLMPRDAEAHSNFGMALIHRKRVEDALKHFRRALEIDPRFAAAHYHLGMLHMEEQRYAEAETSLRTAVALRPDYLAAEVRPAHSDLLYLLSHNPTVDPVTAFAEHKEFGERLAGTQSEPVLRHANVPDPERCLQVGFVSGDFRDHSVATFLEPVLKRLAQRPTLELHAYFNHTA